MVEVSRGIPRTAAAGWRIWSLNGPRLPTLAAAVNRLGVASAVGLAFLAVALTTYAQNRPAGPSPGGSSGGSACYSATAACDNNVLPANGWWISERYGQNGCIWKKYKNPLAYNEGYNADEINQKWKREWYPQYRLETEKVFNSRMMMLRDLTAKGVTVDWWYLVTLNSDGTVKKVEFRKESSYSPKGSGKYSDTLFSGDSDQWVKLLMRMRTPVFPRGSVNSQVIVPVNFTNRRSGLRDVPDDQLPHEDKTKEETKGKVKC